MQTRKFLKIDWLHKTESTIIIVIIIIHERLNMAFSLDKQTSRTPNNMSYKNCKYSRRI